MFTVGVTKVLIPRNKDLSLDDLKPAACELGYHAICFHGDIYVRFTKKTWIKTVFRLSDLSEGVL